MEASLIKPFLEHLAAESEKVIKPLFANPALEVEWKSDATPVTYADKKAEEVLRELISKEFPDHGIVGEEFADLNSDAEYTWVLDPIDGTRSYAAGSPQFGTLIALRKNKQPIWGVINICAIDQLYIGNNETAWCNGREVKMRETEKLESCFLLTTDPKRPYLHHSHDGWNALLAATDQYRSWGDCFGYTLLASGGADIMCDPIMSLWDMAALVPVMRGAGATITNWQGNDPVGTGEGKFNLVCAHPRHHGKVVELLNPA
jgi:myo-inositol-1(or 4)-monophosphatase|tara:strand:- start:2795 stop:3574 length:780 start_codon:yes stop_codon:yes gene_type:complete